MAEWTANDIPNLGGRIVVVTGGNDGLGFESAKALARNKAEVILAYRSTERGNLLFRDGRGYTPLKAYSRSKLANLLLAYELQRRFERHRIVDRSSRPSVAPGVSVADKAAGYCRVGLRTFEPVVTTNALS